MTKIKQQRKQSKSKSKNEQKQSKQANTLKGQPKYRTTCLYKQIYIHIYTLQYILHQHAYIGKYSIQNLCVFFRTSLGCRCLKNKTNPINSNQILMHTIHSYIVYIISIMYMLRSVAHWAKTTVQLLTRKNIKENKQK